MENKEIQQSNPKQIPVSKGHWLLKNLPSMAKDMLQHFIDREKELGHTFDTSVPYSKILATSDPDFMRYVLQTNHRNYKKGKFYEILKLALGEGLVTSNGAFWQKQRRLAQPAFHKKSLEDIFAIMGQTAAQYFEELEQKRGTEVDVAREMMTVTAKIVLKALFSNNAEEDLDLVYDSMTKSQRYVLDKFRKPLQAIFYPISGRKRDFERANEALNSVVYRAISERRKSKEKYPDLLQMMMDATDEESNEQMNDQQLRDEMVTMFHAGHETSANGLAWILYLLPQHPEVVAKMRTEIKAVVGDKLPGFEDLRQLSYIRQVIDEGMRLYPPIWIVSRAAVNDDNYKGMLIKKGTTVYCMIYNAHHSETLYENANEFNPDRFTPEKVKARPKMSYLPFGSGPRMCIGNMFALMEMQLLLVGLLQRFDFELVEGQTIELDPLVTLRPKYGIKMKLI